jgi:hypothetical protein
MIGEFWFDIDNPRLERIYKQAVSTALRELRGTIAVSKRLTEADAKRAIDADYSRGTFILKDSLSGRPLRFLEYRKDVSTGRWMFTAPVPTALETAIPGFELTALATSMNTSLGN